MIYACEDPLAAGLTGPGRPYEVMTTDIRGLPCEVYRNHPGTLTGIYEAARARGGDRLVDDAAGVCSYADVFRRADALAATLQDRFGFGHGARAAIALGSRMEWLAAFIAVTQIGGVAVLVNTRGSREELARAIALTRCDLVFADRERAQLLRERDSPFSMILVEAAGLARSGLDLAFEEAASVEDRFRPVEIRKEDGAMILFTSGTTGFPKGALVSHQAAAHSAITAGLTADLQDLRHQAETKRPLDPERPSRTSPAVVVGPMFHVGGVIPFLRNVYFGGPMVMMTKWNADLAFDLLERESPSRMWCVPTMLWDMLNSPRASDENLGRLMHLVSGAASLPPALGREVGGRLPGCMLWTSYGSTEAAGPVTTFGGREFVAHPEACGRPLPTVRIRIVGDDGLDVVPGERGEICVSGANVFTAYVDDPVATLEVFTGGWLRTGDVGFFDTAQRLHIVDRMKNMIISGGQNIYCAEVERVLDEHPAVSDAIAYGLPDARLGERLAATVVLKPDASATTQELQDHVRAHLAIYKIPREVRLTRDPLPRTSTGKHDRAAFKRALIQADAPGV
jgi:long-chain acyl-CoA synthetase